MNIFSKLELKSLNKEKITNFLNNNYFIASISSEIPIGFGLGSSAAYNVCLVNSICILINNLIDSDKKFFTMVLLVESMFLVVLMEVYSFSKISMIKII